MADTWFTSDHHLFHRAMAWYRKYGHWPTANEKLTPEYTTPAMLNEEHNDMLALRWDTTVRRNDIVWVLGDLTLSEVALDQAMRWINARPGRKRLILGNHDPAHPMHSEAHRWLARYYQAFDSVAQSATVKMTLPNGSRHRVLLSHFPYTGDGELKEDRDTQWRLRNEGMPVIHGHVHTDERLTLSLVTQSGNGEGPYVMQAAPQIHVGVDAWSYRPAHLTEITELIQRGLGPNA